MFRCSGVCIERVYSDPSGHCKGVWSRPAGGTPSRVVERPWRAGVADEQYVLAEPVAAKVVEKIRNALHHLPVAPYAG